MLALYPGYEIIKVHEPKRHFVFEIKTVDHTFRLAAHSEDELNQWIFVLERESIGRCLWLHVFFVIKCKISINNYLIIITSCTYWLSGRAGWQNILLKAMLYNEICASWPRTEHFPNQPDPTRMLLLGTVKDFIVNSETAIVKQVLDFETKIHFHFVLYH